MWWRRSAAPASGAQACPEGEPRQGMRGVGRGRLAVGACMAGAALVLSACGTSGVYSLPLPGGADTGDHPMTITADFADVLSLVPQSAVKVGGIAVGQVKTIELAPDGWSARLTLEIRGDVGLPANTAARIEQTNLLGEKFVALSPPTAVAPTGTLENGAQIPLQRTGRSTQIEEVLGALSLLLNGGGVAQVQPIVEEMNKAIGGRESQTRDLLGQFTDLVAGVNEQRQSISEALDSLQTLTGTVSNQREQIQAILEELPEGVRILSEQRPDFVALLNQLDRLGKAGTEVITTTREDVLRDLRAMRPTIQALADNVPSLVGALPILPTFPIPDEILQGIEGGYANVWVSADLRIGETLANLGVGRPDPRYVKPYGEHQVPVDLSNPWINGNGPRRGWPTVTLLPLADAAPPFQRNPASLPLGVVDDATDAVRQGAEAVQDGLDRAADALPQIGQVATPPADGQAPAGDPADGQGGGD
ncbi:MCE family protein [Tomitella fengzijianii]|uniref:MCE family protein n=2 Tax=Tomitella fengzijianii TaxID=2597660 RepID=A0A516X1Q8_9ACTN|nr:MCE family protein [Tomitella fengzijianii]